ncbi:MAG: phosphoesterase [Proteobacteria bacterium]|nr:phosphoesterase [Pseudomonadota bacterium]
MRFVHCADLHLDSPLRGLERYEGAPAQDMREATRRSFANVVDLAQEREVDFVLIAGDVFDGDWLDFNTGLFFSHQLRRLADANIRAFIVRGNHDALSKISKTVPLPKNVHVFKSTKPATVIYRYYLFDGNGPLSHFPVIRNLLGMCAIADKARCINKGRVVTQKDCDAIEAGSLLVPQGLRTSRKSWEPDSLNFQPTANDLPWQAQLRADIAEDMNVKAESNT